MLVAKRRKERGGRRLLREIDCLTHTSRTDRERKKERENRWRQRERQVKCSCVAAQRWSARGSEPSSRGCRRGEICARSGRRQFLWLLFASPNFLPFYLSDPFFLSPITFIFLPLRATRFVRRRVWTSPLDSQESRLASPKTISDAARRRELNKPRAAFGSNGPQSGAAVTALRC